MYLYSSGIIADFIPDGSQELGPPPPPLGTWSKPYYLTSCEGSHMIKDLGHKVALDACKAACVAEPKCMFIIHADDSDHHCELYSDCEVTRTLTPET